MINKQELIKLLGVAMVEKSKLDGQIELLGDQLRMISQKEADIIARAKKQAEEAQNKEEPKQPNKKVIEKPKEEIKTKQ